MTTADSRAERTFGKYRLSRLLGKGGMGEVYEAYDTDKNRTVALKILAEQYSHDERFRTRFQRESHAAAILQEPHVIPIHDWGEADGNLYIDMRLVNGQTLHELLKKGPLEPERAVAIIKQIAAALDAAHAEGLIHRDVKPQNIIITPADFAYLVDFGIAEAKGDTHVTMDGYHVGTFDYMAPERFTEEPITPAADVYSLACVLYQALTGDTPFRAANREVHTALDEVIARGMAKEPDDRYGSAGALGRAAQRALQSNGHSPSQVSTVLGSGGEYPAQDPDWPNAQSSDPATTPTAAAPSRELRERPSPWVLPIVVAVAGALLLGAIGVVIGILISQRPGPEPGPEPTVASSSEPSYAAPEPTTYEAEPSTPSLQPIPTPRATSSPPADPSAAALQELQQLATSDRSGVTARLTNRWVPQLSSKRPGVVDDGITWDDTTILQEHLRLRQRYPGVKLLWSGDWSTFSAPDYWVTVVGLTFRDSSGALAWCRSQGFDHDHCAAKIVSTTHPTEGSTAYN